MSTARSRSRREWPRPSRQSIGRIILTGIVALLFGWLIARNAAERLYDRDRPAAALQFWPPSGPALAATALDQTVMANGIVGPQSRALLEQSLRRSPILAVPLILAGFDASARNDVGAARRLMEEARRRDPRSVIARSWLLDYYLSGGDYAAALTEVGPLMVLQGDAGPAIMAMTTALLQIPQARPALLAQLRTDPWWRTGFFQQASASPELVPAVASLLLAAPNRSNPLAAAREWQALLQGVAAEGRYDLAYRMWLAQLPAEFRSKVTAIYDGDFQGWPGVRPFAWRIHALDDGSAQRVDVPDLPERSALQVNSNANHSEMVADQLAMIPTGAYRLFFKSRRLPDSDPDGAGLGVEIRCMLTGTSLAALSFDPAPAAALQQLDFAVPQGCGSVRVGFFVRPGENPGSVDAQLTGVRLVRRDASLTAREPEPPQGVDGSLIG